MYKLYINKGEDVDEKKKEDLIKEGNVNVSKAKPQDGKDTYIRREDDDDDGNGR